MRYILLFVFLWVFVGVCSSLHAGGYENPLWWNVYIGPKYTFDDPEHESSYAEAFCGIGLQLYRMDISVNINPFVFVVIETKGDIGLRIYETDNLMVRVFTGFGNFIGNERKIDYFDIGFDIGFYKIDFQCCCINITRDKSWIFLSLYYQRHWGYYAVYEKGVNERVYDSINAGIGCRW